MNYGGPKPVYASTNLARVTGSGASAAYISDNETVRDGQVLVGTGADPNQSLSSGFFVQERSLEFTLAVDRSFAWANVMPTPRWPTWRWRPPPWSPARATASTWRAVA